MQSLSHGHKAAFDELYCRYAKKMHFFFYKMFQGNADKAADFMQDIFVKIIDKPQLFNAEMKFSTWIYTMAGNMCRNEFRKAATRNETRTDADLDPLYFENESATAAIDLSKFSAALDLELGKLSEEHKMIFHLRYKENMPVREISEVINCPEGTIKSRLFYTLKKLSVQLHIYNPYK